MARVWHHVTSRGIERKAIFGGDEDYRRFIDFLGELPGRYGFRIHGYVLMGNHYHLLVEDPELLISDGIKWLNMCYGMSFNRRHGRVGSLFQGRFKGVILDPEERGLSVSRYVHLNPVRVKALGLDKRESRAVRLGKKSEEGLVEKRLEVLKGYRWSSYRAYVGLEKAPGWLTMEFVQARAGGRAEYRRQVEREIREGLQESPWEEVQWGLVLGSEKIQKEVKKALQGNRQEEKSIRAKERSGVGWEMIIEAVEKEKGEKWRAFESRHGDWGRDMVWLLAQERGRMKLAEIGRKSGSDYRLVAVSIHKLKRKLMTDEETKKAYGRILININN